MQASDCNDTSRAIAPKREGRCDEDSEILAGDIWHVDFGGRVGERYALVLCVPHFAKADVMVCPLTTQLKPRAKSRVRLNIPCTTSARESEIKCEEIHTVPQTWMHRRIAKCPATTFHQAQRVLARMPFGKTMIPSVHL
jgi:mRNA-degrading endonuclease toxin of MazEF toxin-antitoxin module